MKRIILHKKAFYQAFKDISEAWGRATQTYRDIMNDPQDKQPIKPPIAPQQPKPEVKPQVVEPELNDKNVVTLSNSIKQINNNIHMMIPLINKRQFDEKTLENINARQSNILKFYAIMKPLINPTLVQQIETILSKYRGLSIEPAELRKNRKIIFTSLIELFDIMEAKNKELGHKYPQLVKKQNID